MGAVLGSIGDVLAVRDATVEGPRWDGVPRTVDASVGASNAEVRCKPRLGMKCQRPPRNIYEIVRRTLNRNGGGWAWETWSCIIYRESKWNPEVTGAAGERGLTQIHPIHIAWLGWDRWAQMYTPEANVIAALELYRRAGYSWAPWRGGCW